MGRDVLRLIRDQVKAEGVEGSAPRGRGRIFCRYRRVKLYNPSEIGRTVLRTV